MKNFIKSLKIGFPLLTLIVFILFISYLNESTTSADLTNSVEEQNSTSLKKDNTIKFKAFIDPETGNLTTPDINELEQIPESSFEFQIKEQEEVLVEEDAPGGGKMVVLPRSFLNLVSVEIADEGNVKAECHRNQK